jgi:MoaA/NifB/PqqE/SkfB family radical SAM enzyme
MIQESEAIVDSEGRLILPPEMAKKFGLHPGAIVRVDSGAGQLRLSRPVSQLAKVYIEATNRCNLECVTCIRHSWDEPPGEMSPAIYTGLIEGLRDFPAPPDIFFGGLGEPLSHPDIVDMIRQAKALGSHVELITNGTLLDGAMSGRLIDAGLDMLWISLDGATPESFKDVRLGAALPEILANLVEFRRARWAKYRSISLDLLLRPQMGIVFVAMKRTIDDLPEVLRLANQMGALHFMVTNVLPYTPEMQNEILYARAINDAIYTSSPLLRSLRLPRMDVNPTTREALYQAMRGDHSLSIAGGALYESGNRCPFLEKGSLAIRHDGAVSPCLALLHNHKSYIYHYERSISCHSFGNVAEREIGEIWNDPDYVAFRKRLQEFNFSPCIYCGGCEYFESNREDCIGSPIPACGGCLWAQGVVQCP